MNRKSSILLLAVAAVGFAPHMASAARITNLAPQSHDFHLSIAGQEQTVTIPANGTWESRLYPIYALIGDHRMKLDGSTDYAFWPDGTLMPQRRTPPDGGPRGG